MARILIIGGHGKVALRLERILSDRGDTVDAVIRDPGQALDVEATGAFAVVADVEQLDTAGLAAVIAGHDAVVWSAGAGGGNPARTYAVDRDAAIRSMDAAAEAGVTRYVMVSYFGSSPDHGVSPENSFYAYAESKAAADEHLRASALDWTVLGPGSLTDDPGTGTIDAKATASGRVSRDDVARVAAEVLARPETAHRTIRFNAGSTPIADALG
ncbi:SDR family oxidoreductase [Agromyces archimandritae]|uniref:SDR family oxidoreductase n=1 Tax=Agromyces archimandritae TaxID=2781962 RepID=A0A975FKX6_9MICO|nr:SDR family oxidoreductase [Agromyces archimandritae]QTX03854.1 SDR family oxidoreductase [Agromyces archimandritae]